MKERAFSLGSLLLILLALFLYMGGFGAAQKKVTKWTTP
jgi:hypothetical protein